MIHSLASMLRNEGSFISIAAANAITNLMDANLKSHKRIEALEAAMQEIADLNNKRDRFSSEIDTIITRALGEAK